MRKNAYIALFLLSLLCGGSAWGKIIDADLPLYIYKDTGEKNTSNFTPSGYMGIPADVRILYNCQTEAARGETSVKVSYHPSRRNTWAGVYWLEPANNWGELPNEGFDLSRAKRFSFYAKGETGKEIVSFGIGGVSGEFGDTDRAVLGRVALDQTWREIVIPVDQLDLERVVGGFFFTLDSKENPEGAVFYLDEIRYE